MKITLLKKKEPKPRNVLCPVCHKRFIPHKWGKVTCPHCGSKMMITED